MFIWGLKLLSVFKKIKIQAFADQRHQQGWGNIPRGAINIYETGVMVKCVKVE